MLKGNFGGTLSIKPKGLYRADGTIYEKLGMAKN